MKQLFFLCCLLLTQIVSVAQFAPPAGQVGTTAIYKDSSIFVGWASGCSVVRGYQDISNTSLGYASAGDSSMALGKAGTNGVVSLGDGGYAILSFADPITNIPGWDFAVFENSFNDTFLELAFVEVSSDGINYFRFPAVSNTQTSTQIGNFGSTDATLINNLAGKYRALYGTPFDLNELSSQTGLNINKITYVKIVDVVGCIQNTYATYDSNNNKVNDPWNTPFASSGFDLDAVGVIHNITTGTNDLLSAINFNIFPNPAKGFISIQFNNINSDKTKITIIDYKSEVIKTILLSSNNQPNNAKLDISDLNSGIYFISVFTQAGVATKKFVITND